MESLIRLISTPDRLQSTLDGIPNIFDLTRLNNNQLLKISDPSKLTPEELYVVSIATDKKIIKILRKLITPSFTLQDLKSIEFNRFSDIVQQGCLGHMLMISLSTDLISAMLDQMRSVNYGIYSDTGNCQMNPLLHCCRFHKFDQVKLLVERYGADIEHLSYCDTTAIMYSAENNNVEITKYLYDKGALLETTTRDIAKLASKSIQKWIRKWETDKMIQQQSDLVKMKSDYQKQTLDMNELKLKYDKQTADLNELKLNCEKQALDLNELKLNCEEQALDLNELKLNYEKLKFENNKYEAYKKLYHS